MGLLLAVPMTTALAQSSPLAGHPSRYLGLHAQDPVHWQLWGPEALAQARREGRLLYVSSGYFACHWCHVMRRESYLDPAIAALLNEHFVPVKVDRELLPDLDASLIDFVRRTHGLAGWPLNVIVTPEGYPLLGFTYLAPDELKASLTDLAGRWREEPAELRGLAKRVTASLQATGRTEAVAVVTPDRAALRAALLGATYAAADELAGGFGAGSKFPLVPRLRVLLRLYRQAPEARLRAFLELTLERMAGQGLSDLVGGGFFRYTVDPVWQVPHFEKMLSDNAQLALLYLEAAAALGRPEFAAVGRRTLDFMLRELAHADGGFAAALSAVDDHEREGAYYLWQPAELQRLLTPASWAVARLAWGLDRSAALESGLLPRQVQTPAALAERTGRSVVEVDALLSQARGVLLAARSGRHVPQDDKRIAGWNGLALSALAAGAELSQGERYRIAGRRLRGFVLARLWDGERLRRAITDRGAAGSGALEDYAYVAQGLLDWALLEDGQQGLVPAAAIARQAWRRFYRPGDVGGWQLGEERLLQYGALAPVLVDQVTPSPSALLIATSLELANRLPAGDLRALADAAQLRAHAAIGADPLAYGSHAVLLLGLGLGVDLSPASHE